jgi:aminopeptidase N
MKIILFEAFLFTLFFISGIWPAGSFAQPGGPDSQPSKKYQATPARINDLIHTRLAVSFDYKNKYLHGKEWVTIKPHFYPTDSLRLDAKGMDVHEIALFKNGQRQPLHYEYDGMSIAIRLDKVYKFTEHYTVFIDYTSKPEELKGRKRNEKGLYFVNPDGTDKNKPIQVWTEGETENSSVWFPTIDKPNQKTTQEISITVPSRYVTLSNGRLVTQIMNAGGTRTDSWKMEQPHAPYLFMMAVGDFKIHKEYWHGKEVSYYLEPRYAPYAKDIFGETPAAIGFFSGILGVNYPWSKYSQVVVRDYVSGAMENTTAVVFGESTQGTKKELADRYYNTGIAHELFHQWFGDYVTTESWSNLTLNESLAVLGEYLWLEYKYGKDAADAHHFEGMKGYLSDQQAWSKDLVRFTYADKQEVFDGVTYQKGGAILYMLRNYLGVSAFNRGLHLYLVQNAYKPAEVHHLRLAFEEVSGMDLNWFFNQWFFGAGHPELHISYKWDATTGIQTVYLQQKQPGRAFVLPLAIDIYAAGKKERHSVWTNKKQDTLTFPASAKPDLVNVDAHKILLLRKTDIKPIDQFAFQYIHAPLYADRLEAVEAALRHQKEKASQKILDAALKDKFYKIRIKAIQALDFSNEGTINRSLPILRDLVKQDENNLVKAAAINALGTLKMSDDLPLFKRSLNTESNAVQAASLMALGNINPHEALLMARQFEHDPNGKIHDAVLNLYTTYGGNNQWTYIYNLFDSLAPPKKNNIIQQFARLTGQVENVEFAMKGIVAIKELGIIAKQYGLGPRYIELLNEIKKNRILLNDKASAQKADEAIFEIEKQ